MRSEQFLNKLESYFDSTDDFMSSKSLNEVYNAYLNISDLDTVNWDFFNSFDNDKCELISEQSLEQSLDFLDNPSILDLLKVENERTLDLVTFTSFRNKFISYLSASNFVLRTTRYV